jgi:hypothetical protein
MSEEQNAEKKIIIDEDWKSQVEAEKEAARLKNQPAEAEQKSEQPADTGIPLPEPTLSFLAGTMYVQGAIAMGLLPNPTSDKQPKVQIEQARHAIDMLAMLQQKTEGNRTPDESEEIEFMLHQLRMAFITVSQK